MNFAVDGDDWAHRVIPMPHSTNTETDRLHLIRAECRDIPELHLTTRQLQRLRRLDAITSDITPEQLEAPGFCAARVLAHVKAGA